MRHPTGKLLPLLCTALLAPALRADPAADATLAIASVDPRGSASRDQADLVSDLLTATLVNGGKLRVVERAQLAKVMKEQALASSGVMGDDVQIKVAQLVGARFLLVATVLQEGQRITITGRAIDSSTGQLAFADNVQVGADAQLGAGARQFARKLQDKLVGGSSAQTSGEVTGDFDPTQIKEAARQIARLLAVRFPKVEGKLKDVIPDGSSSCRFPDWRSTFSGERFLVYGVDSVTGQELEKGIFLLKNISDKGCSGKVKSSGADEISDGDTLRSIPLKVSLDPLASGAGADQQMGVLLSTELRESLKSQPAFEVADSGAQVTLVGRISGAKGRRAIEVQAMDKQGAVVQRWDLNGTF